MRRSGDGADGDNDGLCESRLVLLDLLDWVEFNSAHEKFPEDDRHVLD